MKSRYSKHQKEGDNKQYLSKPKISCTQVADSAVCPGPQSDHRKKGRSIKLCSETIFGDESREIVK